MMTITRPLPSQYALLGSFFGYLVVIYATTPRQATPLRLATSREAISICHCTFMTLATIYCLRWKLPATLFIEDLRTRPVADYELPIITTRSELANALTAIETGYLLQDSIMLLLAAQSKQVLLNKKISSSRDARGTLRGLNLRHLGWHHALLGSAFVVLQIYIARGREKGILIIAAMLLMNASSVPGTVRWFLLNFRPDLKQIIRVVILVYLVSFAVFRVGLVYYILKVFGEQLHISALDAFLRLRLPCKLGMSSLAVVNTFWLISATRSFLLRELGRRRKSV
jgi:hypothetical protein